MLRRLGRDQVESSERWLRLTLWRLGKLVGVAPTFLIAWLALCGVANAQLSGGLQFPGPGTAHSAGGSACTPNPCPGDISGWGSAYAAYSWRCYTFAYSGNVILIQNVATPATQSLLTCFVGVVGVTGSALATTCATACEINTWYNQSGGAGPDLTAAFGGPRARATLASFAGQPSTACSNAIAGNIVSAAAPAALSQPLTAVFAVLFPTFVASGTLMDNNGFAFQPLLTIGGGNRAIQAGGSRDDFTGGAEPVLESIVSMLDGASTTMKINGAAPTTGSANPGPNGIANADRLSVCSSSNGGAFITANVYEIILMSGTKNPTEQAAIVANQRTIGTGW